MERHVLPDDRCASCDIQGSDKKNSLGEIRARPRSAVPGLHGACRLRAIRRSGSRSKIRRYLEAAEMAALEFMTTLVTGASGFIGGHLARLLTRRVQRVRVLVRPQSQL